MGLEVEVVGESNKFDVIVIGGGIAGMVASTIVTNKELKSCFIEKEVPGGKLLQIDTVHNFSQYPGIKGQDLALGIFKSAVDDNKTTYANGNVVSMKSKNDLFYLYTEDGLAWECKAIIIATGTIVKKLNIPSEEVYVNRGVSYCVVCDASLAKGKKVVVIGNSLHIDYLKQQTQDITIIPQNEVKEFKGDATLKSVVKQDGTIVPCDMAFIQLGFEASNKFLIPEIKKNDKGEVVVDSNMHTSFPGAFACGDCVNNDKKLIEIAMQQAGIAANEAVDYIKSRKW